MFNNTSSNNNNQQNNTSTPSLFSSNPTGLFANLSAPTPTLGTGGLFGNSTPNISLFSNAHNNQLKSSQRKQGGLFSSLGNNKSLNSDQPPKLNFPGISNKKQNTLFDSINQNSSKQLKKDNNQNLFSQTPGNSLFSGGAGSLFSGGANTLFSGNSPPGNTLFGQKNNNEQKRQDLRSQQQKKQIDKPGLFSNNKTTFNNLGSNQNEKKQVNPSPNVFGNTQNSLFGNKKQNSILISGNIASEKSLQFRKPEQNSFFSKPQQNAANSTNKQSELGVFSSNKTKIQQKKQQNSSKTGGLFSNIKPLFPTIVQSSNNTINTPNTPLFGQKKVNQNNIIPQQVPAFSLTGNTKKSTQQNQLKPSSLFSTNTAQQIRMQQNEKTSNKAEESRKKQNVDSSYNVNNVLKSTAPTGSFFSNKGSLNTLQTNQNKGLFMSTNNQQTIKATDQKKQPISSENLFGGNKNVSLFSNNNKTEEVGSKKQEDKIKSVQITPNQTKSPSVLLATFSGNNISQQPVQISSRQARTISFSEKKDENQTKTTENFKEGLKNSPLLTQNSQKNFNQKKQNKQKQAPQPIARSRMVQQSFFKQDLSKKQVKKEKIFTSFEINKLMNEATDNELITCESRHISQKIIRNSLKEIQEWIELGFSRYDQIPTSQVLGVKYNLHKNEDVNRFLNDLYKEVIKVINLPFEQKSFKLVNKLFLQILDKLGIKQYLFNCINLPLNQNALQKDSDVYVQISQLNTSYFLTHQIYKFTPQSIQFNLDSQQLQQYIISLIRKFISNQLQSLQFIQSKIQLLKAPYNTFYQLISYILKYKKFRLSSSLWKERNPIIVELVQDFQKKIIHKVVSLLSQFVQSNFYSFPLINKQYTPQLINLLQNFSYTQQVEIVDLTLKIILNSLQLGLNGANKIDIHLSPQVRNILNQTKSLQLLPLRTLFYIMENNHNRSNPSAHDLFRYINGPQWLDWLQIYLGNYTSVSNDKELSFIQAKYLVRILTYPNFNKKKINRQSLSARQFKYIDNLQKKILSRKRPIYKFLKALKQENMLNIFYQILLSLICDYDSYRRVQELFFKQRDQISYEFRNVVAQICNYPVHQLKQQIPFMQQKVLYFLRIVEVAPQRTLSLQRLIFQNSAFLSAKSSKQLKDIEKNDKNLIQDYEVGHKICHLLIDASNYFGLKNNQFMVAKCISGIKSLLQNEKTSLAMKIAMAVNKPQIIFIKNALAQSNQFRLSSLVIDQMLELLQYFLISQEFVSTIALKLLTNNSQNVHLQKMYSVRYSDKDYLPFVKNLIDSQYEQLNDQSLFQGNTNKNSIIITFSSYWFLKTLQVFVQAFRQQKISQSKNQTKLLYLLNLILQKFLIPFSSKVTDQDKAKMVEQSIQNVSNPVYAITSSISIPKILLYLVQALNTIEIIQILQENLKYRLLRSGYKFDEKSKSKKTCCYTIVNEKLQQSFSQNENKVYFSLKILKQLLQTYRLYQSYRNRPSQKSSKNMVKGNHFMYKLLSKLKCLQDLQFFLFLKSFSKSQILQNKQDSGKNVNLVIGLITLLLIDSNRNSKQTRKISVENLRYQSLPINLKQQNYQKPYIIPVQNTPNLVHTNKRPQNQISNFSLVQQFYSTFGQMLNFQTINNFLITSTNRYVQSFQSLQCLSIQCLSLIITGQSLFGDKSSIRNLELSINIPKYVGLYNFTNQQASNINEVISQSWLIQNFQLQIEKFLCSKNSSIQIKHEVLNFLYQILKLQKTNNNFLIAKRVFYKYLIKHLNQQITHSQEQINRLNLIVIKILNILEQKDFVCFTQQVNNKLLDALMYKMLCTCSKIMKSSQNLTKLVKSFIARPYYSSQLSYYHLQRTIQQRQMIKVGEAYQISYQIIQLIQKRFFDKSEKDKRNQIGKIEHTWKSIQKITSLVIKLNLASLTSILMDNKFSKEALIQLTQIDQNKRCLINLNLPRNFIESPLEVFLTEARNLGDKEISFKIYKQNLVDWLSFYSTKLGSKAVRFLNWILTVDKNLFSNQPFSSKSWQLFQKKYANIICSHHMGNYNHTAVELFGENQNQAINLVKQLYDSCLKNLEQGLSMNQVQYFSIIGYCLQWIRSRNNTSQILQHLVKNALKNLFWLNTKTLENSYVVKYVLSLISIGRQYLQNNELKKLREPVLDLIHKYKEGKSQISEVLVQQLISVLISIPPQIDDSRGFRQLINIWKFQTNNQFFFNQARLMLELAQKFPNQLAKSKVLTQCRKVQKSSSNSQYLYNLRNPQSMSFVWALKVASVMMSSQSESAIIFDQITGFYNLKSSQIFNVILRNSSPITLASMEELEACLQFLLTLISSKSWINVYRKQFQKITYLLSHKTINFFSQYINSKSSFTTQSDMQKKFKSVRLQSFIEQISNQPAENQLRDVFIDKDSVFKMIMEIKIINCLKIFVILMNNCFQQSWYIHKYFNQQVFDNYRYGVSFWDRMNKLIIDLIKFTTLSLKKWKRSQNLSKKLDLMNQCINSLEYFVESGYLSSIINLPENSHQLFQGLYVLSLQSIELGTVHLIQQRSFRQRFQCLMKGNIQKYAKKVIESTKQQQTMFENDQQKSGKEAKVVRLCVGQLKRTDFEKIQRNLVSIYRGI